MAPLTPKKRANLPKSDFAVPSGRGYPIPDKNHARNALARVAQNGTPAEKQQVRRAVKKKFPHIDMDGKSAFKSRPQI